MARSKKEDKAVKGQATGEDYRNNGILFMLFALGFSTLTLPTVFNGVGWMSLIIFVAINAILISCSIMSAIKISNFDKKLHGYIIGISVTDILLIAVWTFAIATAIVQ